MKKKLYYSLLVTEIILYMIFMIFDVSGVNNDTTWIKYSGMLLLFAFSLIEIKNWDKRHIAFRIAFLSTLCADMFLLVLNNNYELGISFFIIAQISYFLYQAFDNFDKKRVLILLCTYLIMEISGICTLFALKMVNFANILAFLYFFLLIINFAYSILNSSKNEFKSVLSVGFGLFICCDICVGLNNLDIILSNESLYFFVSYTMWMFYLPSQVLIVSSLDKKYKQEVL